MLFSTQEEIKKSLEGKGEEVLDLLIYNVYFNEDEKIKRECAECIRDIAKEKGIYPASIHYFYTEYMRKQGITFTVPAFNIRFLPYHSIRRIFRSAVKREAGPFIIEIARSEIEYTGQKPFMYSACVFAAAVREGYSGPVFIQGDHFQFNRKRFFSDREGEIEELKSLIVDALNAGFLNIDIDASTLIDLESKDEESEQRLNGEMTALMTEFIRNVEKEVTVSIGGEIGEIGGRNSTPDDLRAFMKIYNSEIDRRGALPGLSKISVQTGTKHGGFILPDGRRAHAKVDFEVIRTLSKIAREEFNMGGVVQHGASTLPDELFHLFPEAGTLEIHLATEFQNIILDHRALPQVLKEEMRDYIFKRFGFEKGDESDEQFYYRYRKYCAKDFNQILWNMNEDILNDIMEDIERKVDFYFDSLKVTGRRGEVEIAEREGLLLSHPRF